MKILLVALNASYMHTNLSIRCLEVFAKARLPGADIQILEFTINQPVGEILRGIGFSKADAVLFSTYIWNAQLTAQIIPDIKKILPSCILGAGGPEFGYAAEKYLKLLPSLDFIIFGEGENSFVQLVQNDFKNFSNIPGIFFRSQNQIIFSGQRDLMKNLDELPFTYPELLTDSFDGDNKIYYYESSRGCPYDCSYCLSSVDKRVRFKSLDKTCRELQIFLDANVKLVKFVDRTYNLNPERYIKIWEYILNHHNKKTMFHFEIEAEYLSQEALEFLQQVPPGVMQFEIGVQTANKTTLEAINRSTHIEALAKNIRRIPRTIHQHLDLIAGLPYENLDSFGKSFDFVMDLKPDALQLGFLKILPGTQMENFAKSNGWQWMENPVYETFSTPYMSFLDMAFLKNLEILTDVFWNKGIFSNTMNYVFRKTSPWKFLFQLTKYGEEIGAFAQARRDLYWFNFIFDFVTSRAQQIFEELNIRLVQNLLRYDFVLTGKKGNFPIWYSHRYSKEKHRDHLEKEGLLHNCRVAFSNTEYEEFDFDVEAAEPENSAEKIYPVLIKYNASPE